MALITLLYLKSPQKKIVDRWPGSGIAYILESFQKYFLMIAFSQSAWLIIVEVSCGGYQGAPVSQMQGDTTHKHHQAVKLVLRTEDGELQKSLTIFSGNQCVHAGAVGQ